MKKSSKIDELKYYEIPIRDNFILDARTKISTSSNREVHYERKKDEKNLVSIKLEKTSHFPTFIREAKVLEHLKDIERIPKLI